MVELSFWGSVSYGYHLAWEVQGVGRLMMICRHDPEQTHMFISELFQLLSVCGPDGMELAKLRTLINTAQVAQSESV